MLTAPAIDQPATRDASESTGPTLETDSTNANNRPVWAVVK